MRDHIDIRLEWNKRQMDLQIPSGITISRLENLLEQVFKENHTSLPKKWRMKPKNKQITIGEFDVINDFPIGDGDVFQIVTGETYESI